MKDDEIYSRIRLNKPSKKAVLHSMRLSHEFLETHLEELRGLFNDVGYDIHEDALNVEIIKNAIITSIDSNELLSSLCSKKIGTGYLLGIVMAVIEQGIEEAKEAEEDESI